MLPQCLPPETMQKSLFSNMGSTESSGVQCWVDKAKCPLPWGALFGRQSLGKLMFEQEIQVQQPAKCESWSCSLNKPEQLFFYHITSKFSDDTDESWASPVSLIHSLSHFGDIFVKKKLVFSWEDDRSDFVFFSSSFHLNGSFGMPKSNYCVLFCQGVKPFAEAAPSIHQPFRVEIVFDIEVMVQVCRR